MSAPDKTDTVTITPESDITLANAKQLKQQLQKAIQEGALSIRLDLIHVKVVDSSGLSVFIAASNSLKNSGGRLELINVAENILKLLKITRLDKHFSVQGK